MTVRHWKRASKQRITGESDGGVKGWERESGEEGLWRKEWGEMENGKQRRMHRMFLSSGRVNIKGREGKKQPHVMRVTHVNSYPPNALVVWRVYHANKMHSFWNRYQHTQKLINMSVWEIECEDVWREKVCETERERVYVLVKAQCRSSQLPSRKNPIILCIPYKFQLCFHLLAPLFPPSLPLSLCLVSQPVSRSRRLVWTVSHLEPLEPFPHL